MASDDLPTFVSRYRELLRLRALLDQIDDRIESELVEIEGRLPEHFECFPKIIATDNGTSVAKAMELLRGLLP